MDGCNTVGCQLNLLDIVVHFKNFSNLLCEIVNSRKQSYAVIKPRRETIDDFVNRYLREHVLKIWPEGWMKLEELQKEEHDKRFEFLRAYAYSP